MIKNFQPRHTVIAIILILGVFWSFASAREQHPRYPNGQFLVTAGELKERMTEEPLVVVDVRDDEYFDGKVVPGAIRLPWTSFRRDSKASGMGGVFVGVDKAQEILGRHGIFRNDSVILYDSVARDGGATASYVFWVLDLLGHDNMAVLERGIDGWLDAGGDVVNTPQQREPLLYQAPAEEIRLRRRADENFILPRLGDPYYRIIDVRSRDEYLGKSLNTALDGTPLKPGHIPGAYNIDYQDNWTDPETKGVKSYFELTELYRGITPDSAVITYCHSARRGSFGYYILRLMGFKDVLLYDNSWFGWGRKDRFYPVETTPHTPAGRTPPSVTSPSEAGKTSQEHQAETSPRDSGEQTGRDYISCGG
jgi:thiosulfate/3-mercaptopyruvate sulfurtransferase